MMENTNIKLSIL